MIAILTYRRRFWSVALPAVLAFAPFGLIPVQSYGGEGIYRVFLFSSAWCALIIAMRLIDLRRLFEVRWAMITMWAVLAGLASAQATVMGMYPMLLVSKDEVTASQHFATQAPNGSTLVMAASNFPGRLDRRYVLHNPMNTVNDPALNEIPDLRGEGLDDISPQELATQVADLAEGHGYLVISQAMLAYDEYYGVYTSGTLEDLAPRLLKTPYWRVWFKNDEAIILEARPA